MLDRHAVRTDSAGERWQVLVEELLAEPATAATTQRPGALTVIGSGLGLNDLAHDAKSAIIAADQVFYCLYDPVTQAWINDLRPDAYDLCALYSEALTRYETYVQMAEAMLHFVRKGQHVVAIYYGHPGVFASPTHRAVAIAQAEGHHAVMRPGISALDHLVADVGFDPAYPGLLTYEASDMLLRGRALDTTLHVVLWQVGIVGEFGYRNSGYRNDGFHVLAEALETRYGPDWSLVHYVSARFPGTEPLIDRVPIGRLRDPEFVGSLSALSTFYIPPRDASSTDRAAALALGAIGEDEFPESSPPAYDIAGYHAPERQALDKLASFSAERLPAQRALTPGIAFLVALSEDRHLIDRFRDDPQGVLQDPRFGGLSQRAKDLLLIRHPLAVDALLRERL